MARVKKNCPVCGIPMASNGLPAHLKARHPNYDGSPKKPIQTVSEDQARVRLDMELGSFLEMVKTIKAA